MSHSLLKAVPLADRTWRICLLFATLLVGLSSASAQGSELRRSAIVRAVQQARPSIVNIHGKKTVQANEAFENGQLKQVNGMGTGIVIDRRGYLVTNHHVIEGVQQINVTLGG